MAAPEGGSGMLFQQPAAFAEKQLQEAIRCQKKERKREKKFKE